MYFISWERTCFRCVFLALNWFLVHFLKFNYIAMEWLAQWGNLDAYNATNAAYLLHYLFSLPPIVCAIIGFEGTCWGQWGVPCVYFIHEPLPSINNSIWRYGVQHRSMNFLFQDSSFMLIPICHVLLFLPICTIKICCNASYDVIKNNYFNFYYIIMLVKSFTKSCLMSFNIVKQH